MMVSKYKEDLKYLIGSGRLRQVLEKSDFTKKQVDFIIMCVDKEID